MRLEFFYVTTSVSDSPEVLCPRYQAVRESRANLHMARQLWCNMTPQSTDSNNLNHRDECYSRGHYVYAENNQERACARSDSISYLIPYCEVDIHFGLSHDLRLFSRCCSLSEE